MSFIWILSFGFWISAFADVASVEAKISRVVKEYIVKNYPLWADKRIEVSFRQGDANLKRIDKWGEVERCEILNLYSGLRPVGRVALPVRFVDVKGRKQIGLITTRIQVYDSAVVARVRKKKGETILAQDLEIEERDVGMLGGKYFIDPSQLVGSVASANINRGTIVQPWMTKPMPVIAKGGEVSIIFYSPHIVVSAPGKVLGDAYLNQKVKVKRNGRKRTFEAKVVSSREVEVII